MLRTDRFGHGGGDLIYVNQKSLFKFVQKHTIDAFKNHPFGKSHL